MQTVSNSALIIVDIQNDFMETGTLKIPNASLVIPVINNIRKTIPFKHFYLTSDWHPLDHISFSSNHPNSKPFTEIHLKNGVFQVLWPDHCVQNTSGALFHKDLIKKETDIIIRKGIISDVDSYSCFGCYSENTGLLKDLQAKNIKKLFFAGVAFDYCVKESALDGLKKGFEVYIVRDAVKALNEEGSKNAWNDIEELGGKFIDSSEILNYF